MSTQVEFWTKDAVKRHSLPSTPNEFSSTGTYLVGQWVWYKDSTTASNTGLYVCHTAVTSPGSWTGSTNWNRINDVSSLFSSDNTSYNGSVIKITAASGAQTIKEYIDTTVGNIETALAEV